VNGTEPGGGAGDDIPTLLIVDDSADLRAYVRDHFASRFRVLESANGAEGLATAQRELPDVVVSDLMMPDTDGHALVRALRASPTRISCRSSCSPRIPASTSGLPDCTAAPTTI
jgi:CheY-like chemotaxis protein